MKKQQFIRSTREVFEDHLQLRKSTSTEKDIEGNYAENVVILTGSGVYFRHDGIRKTASILNKVLPHGKYEYIRKLVEGQMVCLEWKGCSKNRFVDGGADSFVIQNGKIVGQTIHFTP